MAARADRFNNAAQGDAGCRAHATHQLLRVRDALSMQVFESYGGTQNVVQTWEITGAGGLDGSPQRDRGSRGDDRDAEGVRPTRTRRLRPPTRAARCTSTATSRSTATIRTGPRRPARGNSTQDTAATSARTGTCRSRAASTCRATVHAAHRRGHLHGGRGDRPDRNRRRRCGRAASSQLPTAVTYPPPVSRSRRRRPRSRSTRRCWPTPRRRARPWD